MKNRLKFIIPSLFLLLVITACDNNQINLEHIHGLGYTSDGKQILIPAHNGLVSYSEGQWKNINAPKHDYMGFQTVDNGFYSSGHPAPGSGLKNPMGIVKSTDFGKTLSKLGLEGENDFHGMAVGYKSHAIYVINEQPNSKMDSSGLFYSTDDAKTWNKSISVGLNEEPTAIAVHPTNEKMVVIGTKTGLLASDDFGNHFEKIIPDLYITALYFNEKGDLYVAGANSSSLIKINVNTKEKKELNIPTLDNDDAVSYIAQSPTNEKEIVIATFKKNVYLSSDSGEKWTEIADQGKGISQK